MYLECIKDVVVENKKCFTKGNAYGYVYDERNQMITTNDNSEEHVVSWLEDGIRDPFFKQYFKLVTI